MDTPWIYIDSVKLRNIRKVYRNSTTQQYLIRSEDDTGRAWERKVPRKSLDHIQSTLSGKSVAVDDIINMLDEGCLELSLSFEYGYQRRYEVQDILLAMCADGLAVLKYSGRKGRYSIL